jgi:hypothetical protein
MSLLGSDATGAGTQEPQELSQYELANNLKPLRELSQMEAKREIARINSDRAHPFWDAGSIHHKSAMERYGGLFKSAAPTPEQEEAAAQKRKEALEEEMVPINERNAKDEANSLLYKYEAKLQTEWGANWEKNRDEVHSFIQTNLSDKAIEELEKLNPKGRRLGDDPQFSIDLFNFMKKHGR